jgi:hypothetical protein
MPSKPDTHTEPHPDGQGMILVCDRCGSRFDMELPRGPLEAATIIKAFDGLHRWCKKEVRDGNE